MQNARDMKMKPVGIDSRRVFLWPQLGPGKVDCRREALRNVSHSNAFPSYRFFPSLQADLSWLGRGGLCFFLERLIRLF